MRSGSMENSQNEAVKAQQSQENLPKVDSPQKVCNLFRARMICFISDMEKLLRTPNLIDDEKFLTKISGDIVALNSMACSTGGCSESILEAGNLIQNLITDKIEIHADKTYHMHTLDIAKKYREDKSTEKALRKLLSNYLKKRHLTESFINQLKVLAFDINVDN